MPASAGGDVLLLSLSKLICFDRLCDSKECKILDGAVSAVTLFARKNATKL